ncbi:hypothetical protein SALBM217S_05332 [Streptomyces griseoloalbus]
MQKSTGPAPSLSLVSAAIDGLCAAVLRNSEVTLSAKGTSVCGGPAGEGRARHAWVARAGEHGLPRSTERGGGRSSTCEENVRTARDRAHTENAYSGCASPARGSRPETVHRRRPVRLAGPQHGSRGTPAGSASPGKLVLGLQAQPVALPVHPAAAADEGPVEEVAGRELKTRLVRRDAQGAPEAGSRRVAACSGRAVMPLSSTQSWSKPCPYSSCWWRRGCPGRPAWPAGSRTGCRRPSRVRPWGSGPRRRGCSGRRRPTARGP